MFNVEMIERSYIIEIGTEILNDILERDKMFPKPSVVGLLEGLEGVSNVKYDEDFDPFIYLTIGDHEDHEETWKMIRTIIGA